jgi:hypothetical protein
MIHFVPYLLLMTYYMQPSRMNQKGIKCLRKYELFYTLFDTLDPVQIAIKIFSKGGVILIGINWYCNYDLFSEACRPKYSIKRFDTKFKTSSASSGFNFRFSNKYYVNSTEYRTLYKAYGLRFIINVNGQAGKFSILPFMLSIGSGIGLLSISQLVADMFLLNCTGKKKLYKKVKEIEANEVLEESEYFDGVGLAACNRAEENVQLTCAL